MTDFDAPDDASKFIPVQPERPVPPARHTFRPWHRPRKQWVRRFQWEAITKLIAEKAAFPNDARVFRYLGLTGEDLLDVRTLYPMCDEYNLELKYVGINDSAVGSAADLQLNVAEDELRSRARIHKLSRVERGRVEAVAEPTSVLLERVRENGPYHVINIDLCDHVARQAPLPTAPPTYIDAIAAVLEMQTKTQLQPWALFLTTRVRPGDVDGRNLEAFILAIRDNVARSSEFEKRLSELAPVPSVLDGMNGLSLAEFTKAFAIGFGKWMAGYLLEATPPCRVSMGCSGFYSVYANDPDMLSLAFLCEPLPAGGADRYGLALKTAQDERIDETSVALSLLEATQRLINIDELLQVMRRCTKSC